MSQSSPFATSAAALLTNHGFSSAEASLWSTHLTGLPPVEILSRAQSWLDVGMTGADAVAWDDAGWYPGDAYLWFHLGFTAGGANFVMSRIADQDAHDWLGSGMSPGEIILCVGSGCRSVSAALALVEEIENGTLDRGTLRLQAALNDIDIHAIG